MKNPFLDFRIAQDWIQMVEGERGQIRKLDIYPRLQSWIGRTSPHRILEIGCGQGICSDQLELTNRTYVGVDPAPLLIERAREMYSSRGRTFVDGTATALPLGDQEFDAAYSINVLHLVDDLDAAGQELSRALKPGGRFLIIMPNPEGYPAWTHPYRETCLDGVRFEGEITLADQSRVRESFYLYPLSAVLDSLRLAGLMVERTESFRDSQNPPGLKVALLIEGTKI